MLKEYMKSLGYEEIDIDRMRNTYPVNRCSDEYLRVMVEKNNKMFIKLGYTLVQILHMTLERPQIFCYEDVVIENKFNYLKKLLGDANAVIKMTIDFPTIYSYDIESIENKINDLSKLGYSRETIIKGIKKYPELLGLSVEDNIKNTISELVKLGFSYDDVIKITSKNMTLFGRDIETIKNCVNKLEGFGYSRKNVISMVKKHPSILNYGVERINGRINDMVGLGIEYKDVLNILLVNPSLFGNDMETITDKKIFYDSLNLFSVFVKSPKELMQGIAKSYARYMYYCSIGIDIYATENGYKRLFIGEERFKNRYGVETDELIKQYDVDKYLESVKSKKIKRV